MPARSRILARTSKLPRVGTTIFTVMSKMAQEHGAINLSQGFPDFPIDEELSDLVNAAMKMYPLTQYPMDHAFWELLAYCAGTGGSILIIGSAAGVATMGILGIDFVWYLRRMAFPAAMGYFGGILTFWLLWH